eukprot:GHVN01033661.1.p1 GENE.GHVN01033661.1~~GHVN01033661.1.p1  ORF type:complete len:226 (-),score=16.12 GHVN01033661.1:88-765(-)
MVRHVVIVSTSAPKLKSHDTGLWLEELAAPYYEFLAKGYDVTIASPKGGPVPIDSASLAEGVFTDCAKKFMHDPIAVGRLSHTTKLSEVSLGSVDALFMAGGHGTGTDFIAQPSLKTAIETVFNSKKVVAAVCHGPTCFAECVKGDGKPLVSGLKVTGFSNVEEEMVKLTNHVPFSLEDKLIELGGIYEKADAWNPKVCVDGNLVTGQNPQSSEACAKAVVDILG